MKNTARPPVPGNTVNAAAVTGSLMTNAGAKIARNTKNNFSVPQVLGETPFYPSALKKGLRSEQALKLAMAEMYVQGVSTRKVSPIVEELCGAAVSSTRVSDCAQRLAAELQQWRDRPLGCCPCLVFDARYEKVRHDGRLRDCAVLIALGITPAGQRVNFSAYVFAHFD